MARTGEQRTRWSVWTRIRSVGSIAVAAIVLGGCTSGNAVSAAGASPETIPQPTVPGNLPLASEAERVDATMPTFSDPTTITNPLFPVSEQRSVLMLGRVDGEPFRTEVTLLPFTRVIEWRGQLVETAVSQYNAFLDGRIDEIAYDYYAQADDGSVWYFGEDVFDFRDGAIVVTEGTWLAGRDGPAAMIMPPNPQVGDAYRTENAPPLVFEEVTVRSTGEALHGPLGPVAAGMIARELHMDGRTEDKTFAPGYGEFFTSDGKDVEALALAVPTDATGGPVPGELQTMVARALDIVGARRARSAGIAAATSDIAEAWSAYRRSAEVPWRVEPIVADGLDALARAVRARDVDAARRAAIDVARSTFDLELRYRPATEIDLARMDLWAAELLLDATDENDAGIGSDAFAIDYIRDRLLHRVAASDLGRIDEQITAIQVGIVDEERAAVVDAAGRLRTVLGSVEVAAP